MKQLTIISLALLLAACTATSTLTPIATEGSVTQPAPLTPTTASTQPVTEAPATAEATAAPTEAVAPTPASATQPDPACCVLNEFITGLDRPLYLTHAGDDRLFVVEQDGLIRITDSNGQLLPNPFLDVSSLITTDGNEQGLLGLAFHPDYANNGLFYIAYTARNGDNTVARYSVSSDPNVADPDSATVLLAIDDPYGNHNGGNLVFGPDGLLYIGTGDGGSAGDPQGNGQNPTALLGKMLRLDVNAEGAQPEIWAMGLRNPWRYSFDRQTGDLFIGDVGQGEWEEISYVPAPLPNPGPNFGWNILEGTHRYSTVGDPAGLYGPVAEYSHSEGGCSVTGGYVYRGSAIPNLNGVYFFADFCSGIIWTLVPDGSGGFTQAVFMETGSQITSFGEDLNGELYVVDRGGMVYKLIGA